MIFFWYRDITLIDGVKRFKVFYCNFRKLLACSLPLCMAQMLYTFFRFFSILHFTNFCVMDTFHHFILSHYQIRFIAIFTFCLFPIYTIYALFLCFYCLTLTNFNECNYHNSVYLWPTLLHTNNINEFIHLQCE